MSRIMEKNGAQETFAGPSLAIAAMQLSASMRTDMSLGPPETEDRPFLNLKKKTSDSNGDTLKINVCIWI